MAKQVFVFKYTLFEVEAVIDNGRLVARQGMRTVVVPIARMQHLYLFEGGDQSQHELLLTYLDRRNRLKRARLYADRGQPAFDALVSHLLSERPEIDIRHLSPAEAWAKVGSKPMEWIVLPALMALGTLLLGVAFTPLFVHGFDAGQATVQLADLGSALASRNISISAQLQTERGLVDDPSAVWFPLVEAGTAPDAPVELVAKITGQAHLDLALAHPSGLHSGILRDVWWEGLSGRQRKKFTDSGVQIAADVRVLDLYAEPETDLQIASTILGLMALLTLLTSVVLWRRRDSEPKARVPLSGR